MCHTAIGGRCRKENVLGLDVSVDNALRVGVRERLGHFVGDSQGIVERERPVSHQPVAQRLALDEWHHVVQQRAGIPVGGAVTRWRFARVVQREDMRVLQSRCRVNLPQKSLGPE